ncbi:hypothetical protein AVEN_9137-1 [Araneus ventricosus]|uniref:Uncharacterized protein n=1 Tax=Araneus ventricosus TaxID=182803 RepID=A0A4Y2J4I0_ARAVE|nr:hypothetical protein AVEN_9137-1 [Araneus ventricosus]
MPRASFTHAKPLIMTGGGEKSYYDPGATYPRYATANNACIVLLYPINPVLHILVGRLSPRWSFPGLPPFLGRPGQCLIEQCLMLKQCDRFLHHTCGRAFGPLCLI